jgi:protein-disulfide isomerase
VRRLAVNRTVVLAAVGVLAAGIATALILVSVLGSGGDKASSATTTGAPAGGGGSVQAAGAVETAALLRGIPQRLNELGNPQAPVTMVEFADLQCPFCRDFTLETLPAIVDGYVRPGKVKLVFAGIAFIGPDSETALRAAYAAGLQGRLWNVVDLLYRNQGAENSGWVTDSLLRSVGTAIPGLDAGAMLEARNSAEVNSAIASTSQQANTAHVDSTPTFFAGPTGGTLQRIGVGALRPAVVREALDKLVK